MSHLLRQEQLVLLPILQRVDNLGAGRMNELTITLITPTLISEGRRVTMTLTLGDGIEDYWRACRQFALAAGYHPETVVEYFSEEE